MFAHCRPSLHSFAIAPRPFCGIMRGVMKSKVSIIRAAFGIRRGGAADEKRRIARYSRGNVRLQLGQIVTGAEYEAQRKRVLAHDFR